MELLKEFDKIFSKYKQYEFSFSNDQLEKEILNYVYYSNSLEGNRLNLAQTTTLLKNNIASGDLPIRDYLETKGHYKALKFILSSAANQYPLDERILKQANKLTLEPYWSIEDSYFNWKKAGQEPGEYKVLPNKTVWEIEKKKGEILPLSDPKTVNKNIKNVIKTFNDSKAHIIERASYLAYNIFIHQAFNDANKRTSRLITTFVTIKEGLPLTAFDNQAKKTNFNHVLIMSHLKENTNILKEFLTKEFLISMKQKIENEKTLKNTNKKGLSFFV